MASLNPISGVEFGKERTARQMRDRAQWERDQADRHRATKRPVGWEHVVEAHENVARAYEQAARKREHEESGVQPKRSHATKGSKRSAWPSVVGSHGLGTADVRTEQGAYWIVTRPTGYRVDYKPWGPSSEVDLGTLPSRTRARQKIAEHALSVGATVRRHATKGHATVKTDEGLVLQCDMSGSCKEPVTHIEDSGFVYCTKHGLQRRGSGQRCRKLTPSELKRLKRGEKIARY